MARREEIENTKSLREEVLLFVVRQERQNLQHHPVNPVDPV